MNCLVFPLAIIAAAAVLSACATPTGSSGAATTVMADDGSVELRVRRGGLFGRREVVVIRPGEAGYDGLRDSVETVQTSSRRPRLTWTIGEPVYSP